MKRYRTILVTAALGLLLLPACERENLLGTLSEGVSFTVTTGAGSAPDPARPAIKGGLSEDGISAGTPAAVSLTGDLVTEEGATLSMTVDSRPMAFAPATSAPADSVPVTKAAPYAKGALSADADLGLVAYTYSEANAAATAWTLYTAPAVTRFYNDKSRSDASSGKWIPAPESRLLWPKEGFIRFFAYAPYTDSNGDKIDDNVTVTAAGGAAPTLGYTVKPVAGQIDLLVADENSTAERSGDPGWRKIDVTMNMLHALTGIRFRIIDGLSIESVKISGVYDKGDLSLSTFPLSWSNLEKSSAPQEPEYELTNLSLGSGLKADAEYDKSGYNITEDVKTLLLMPQTVPAGAKITVTVSLKDGGTTVAGSERTITADIAGQEWKPGTMVTYTITHDGDVYVLHVQRNKGTAASPVYEDIDQLEFSYAGGLRPFYVTSYKISKEGSVMKYEGVDWKLQKKNADGSWSDVTALGDITDEKGNAWVYDMPVLGVHSHLSGQTGADAATSPLADTVTIAALPSEITLNAHTTTLRGFAAVGTKDNPVDLSLKSMPVGAETALKTRTDIARSTANCYVVDRPGWYKIPMVYGNAIKDGADNPAAYMPTTITNSAKVDHAGNEISQPWVSEAYDIEYARLLWQDIPGLLTNISATGTGTGERYIEFYVDPATIHQGNAVIAAYTGEGRESTDPDYVAAWSWHIWVTDADFSPVRVEGPDLSIDAQTVVPVYGLMRQDIGQVAGIEKRDFDKARNGEFRLVQVENGQVVGKTKELKLIQKGVTTADLDDRDWSYAYYVMAYQWGRKDPSFILPNGSQGNTLFPIEYEAYQGGPNMIARCYAYDGRIVNFSNPSMSTVKTMNDYSEFIKNPTAIQSYQASNYMFQHYNRWDNSPNLLTGTYNPGSPSNGYAGGYRRAAVPVKTVYDPSPAGWCVPPPGMRQVTDNNHWKVTLLETTVYPGPDYGELSKRHRQKFSSGGDIFYAYTWSQSMDNTGVNLLTDNIRRWTCALAVYYGDATSPYIQFDGWNVIYAFHGNETKYTLVFQNAIRPCQEKMEYYYPNGKNPNDGGYTPVTIVGGWF